MQLEASLVRHLSIISMSLKAPVPGAAGVLAEQWLMAQHGGALVSPAKNAILQPQRRAEQV